MMMLRCRHILQPLDLMMQVQGGQQAQTVRGQVRDQATYGRLG